MKKILSLMAISIFASVSLFAQSSRIVGQWSSSAGAQTAMLEAMGGKLEEAVSIMTFNEDGKSEIYSKVKSIVDVSGIEMTMVLEIREHDFWTFENNILKLNVNDIEVIELDIKFSDPSLDEAGDMVEDNMKTAFEQQIGASLEYDIEFVTDDLVNMVMNQNGAMLEYTLTRIK